MDMFFSFYYEIMSPKAYRYFIPYWLIPRGLTEIGWSRGGDRRIIC